MGILLPAVIFIVVQLPLSSCSPIITYLLAVIAMHDFIEPTPIVRLTAIFGFILLWIGSRLNP